MISVRIELGYGLVFTPTPAHARVGNVAYQNLLGLTAPSDISPSTPPMRRSIIAKEFVTFSPLDKPTIAFFLRFFLEKPTIAFFLRFFLRSSFPSFLLSS